MFARIFLVLFIFTSGFLSAQNNLIVVNENGDPFILYINEQKLNDSPQSIVKTTKIIHDTCRLKITYLAKNLHDLNQTVYLLENGKSCKNLEFTYSIENSKGKSTLKYISTNVLSTDTSNRQTQASERVRNFFLSQQKEKDDKNRLAENYPPPTPCTKAISDSLLTIQIKYLKDNHIELNRTKDAKWLISNNCLSIYQAQKVLAVFDYEDSKLQLAKFGYEYLIDKDNFLNFLKSLNYKTEKEELRKFYANKTTKQN